MKENSTYTKFRLWNVVNLVLFIGAVFCLRHYIINATNSSLICLIMNLTIVTSIIGLIAYLVDGYTRPQGSITVSSAIDIEADSTLTGPISQDNAELIRQTEEENRRRKEEQWAEIASYTKATFQKIFTPVQIEILLNNIKELTGDENYIAVETSINSHLKSDNLLHFGCNVSNDSYQELRRNLAQLLPCFSKRVFR